MKNLINQDAVDELSQVVEEQARATTDYFKDMFGRFSRLFDDKDDSKSTEDSDRTKSSF